ncbi:MAG: helix-turn-helix domain-containing protein [Qingshengfaniella sp.]
MKKLTIARIFRDRLASLVDDDRGSKARFLDEIGLDRSALSQFLNPDNTRLPRAETLHRIAHHKGVSIDWLLGLENAPGGRQLITPHGIEDGMPLVNEAWYTGPPGSKLRYVPTALPAFLTGTLAPDLRRAGAGERLLERQDLDDLDVEIAMPIQSVQALADGTWIWAGIDPQERLRALQVMAGLADRHYPALRLYLFDAAHTFAPAFSVYGRDRVVFYLGESDLVFTGPEDVRSFTRLFDQLIRKATVTPDHIHTTLMAMADTVT